MIALNVLIFSALEIYSDQCGVQFYTGGRLPPYIIPEFLSSYDLLEVNKYVNCQQHSTYVNINLYIINNALYYRTLKKLKKLVKFIKLMMKMRKKK